MAFWERVDAGRQGKRPAQRRRRPHTHAPMRLRRAYRARQRVRVRRTHQPRGPPRVSLLASEKQERWQRR
jgi:hypothetical protein